MKRYYVSIPNREKYLHDMHNTISEITGLLVSKFGLVKKDIEIYTNCGVEVNTTPMEHIMISAKYITDTTATVFLSDSLQDETCELDRALARYLGATVIML